MLRVMLRVLPKPSERGEACRKRLLLSKIWLLSHRAEVVTDL